MERPTEEEKSAIKMFGRSGTYAKRKSQSKENAKYKNTKTPEARMFGDTRGDDMLNRKGAKLKNPQSSQGKMFDDSRGEKGGSMYDDRSKPTITKEQAEAYTQEDIKKAGKTMFDKRAVTSKIFDTNAQKNSKSKSGR